MSEILWNRFSMFQCPPTQNWTVHVFCSHLGPLVDIDQAKRFLDSKYRRPGLWRSLRRLVARAAVGARRCGVGRLRRKRGSEGGSWTPWYDGTTTVQTVLWLVDMGYQNGSRYVLILISYNVIWNFLVYVANLTKTTRLTRLLMRDP